MGYLCVVTNAAEGAATNDTFMRISKNFKLEEFNCNDGTKVPEEFISNVIVLGWMLQELRDYTKKPIIINSGYRTKDYNKKVGGSPNSMHLVGMAADITIVGLEPYRIRLFIELLISRGKMLNGGIGLYPTFVHYDIGDTRRW